MTDFTGVLPCLICGLVFTFTADVPREAYMQYMFDHIASHKEKR